MKKRHSLILRALALIALLILGVIVAGSSNPIYQSAPEPPSKLKPEAYETKSTADLINLAEAGDWGALKAFVEKTGFSGPESDLAGRLLLPYVRQGYNEARYKLAEIHFYNSYDLQSIPGLFDNTDFLHSPIESCTDVVSGLKWRREIARDFDSAKKAVALWEEAAAGGHTPSQSRLGLELLTGEHLPPNHPRAIELLDMAARSGDVNSAATLARVYYQGRLIPRDDTKCLEYTRMTKNPVLEAALVLLNGRGDKASDDEALKGIAPFKDYSGGNAGALWRARIMLRTKPVRSAPEWASWRLRGSDFTASDYDDACSGNLATWFDRAPDEFLRAGVRADAFLDGGDALGPTGTCLHDAQAGDMIAQHVLGHDRLAQAKAFASAGDSARAAETRREATDWLRRSAAQGFTAAMETLANLSGDGFLGAKPDKVEVAYWLSLATTDFYTPNREERDKALAELTPAEHAAVAKRAAEARLAIAARFTGAGA